MYAYIARQAIYNYQKKVVGYELLYRNGYGNSARIIDPDAATRGVLSDAVTVFGLSQLTNHLPAYINFTRNLLMGDFAYQASPKEIIIEVPGVLEVDEELMLKLGELKRAGYRLALDSYTRETGARFDRITQFFDIIRIDVSKGNQLQRQETVNKLWRGGLQLLAERVETLDDFLSARKLGFELFQGYFFEKPVCLSKQTPPLSASSYGQLMNELLKPDISYSNCCAIIQRDVVLSYLLLRRVRTASYYRGNTIGEIKQALVMMGTDALRRWVCLVLLKQSNVTQSDEMSRKAFLRGRFLERLAENANTRVEPGQCFLLGMFSLLDQVTGQSMTSLMEGVELNPPVKAALLGREENDYSLFLQYAVIYEMANPRLLLPDIGLRLNGAEVSSLYMSCISDTDAAFSHIEGRQC